MKTVLDLYTDREPNAQSTVDIFKNQWASRLPGGLTSGGADLFDTSRVLWPHGEFNVTGKSVLELGPLEGGHTFALHALGASAITAVEGNARAFLKCLVVKELFDLSRAKFLYGDIVKYLDTTNNSFDIIIASGVLYHMCDPLKLLWLIKHHTNRCYIWTHYFDRELLTMAYGERFSEKFGGSIAVECAGYRCEGHVQHYADALDWPGFCGGSAASSVWLMREDILGFLRHIGFNRLEVGGEDTSHQFGPMFSILAQFC